MGSQILHSRPNFQLLQMCNLRTSNEDIPTYRSHNRKKRVTFDLRKRRSFDKNVNKFTKNSRNSISLPPILSKPILENNEKDSQCQNDVTKHSLKSNSTNTFHERACHSKKPSPEKEMDELSNCETVVIKNKPEYKTDNIGESLFSNAVLSCKFNYIKLQLQTGINVNMCNKLGQTPLMRCCFIETANQRKQMFKLLLCYGADIQLADKSGKTVLHYSALLGRSELVGLILNNTLSLDLNGLDKNGKTPLMYSVMSGSVETSRYLVRALCQFGLSVDRTDSSGVTPYIAARTLGYTRIADILLYEGNANASQGDNNFYRCADEWVLMTKKDKPKNILKEKTVLPAINTANS